MRGSEGFSDASLEEEASFDASSSSSIKMTALDLESASIFRRFAFESRAFVDVPDFALVSTFAEDLRFFGVVFGSSGENLGDFSSVTVLDG